MSNDIPSIHAIVIVKDKFKCEIAVTSDTGTLVDHDLSSRFVCLQPRQKYLYFVYDEVLDHWTFSDLLPARLLRGFPRALRPKFLSFHKVKVILAEDSCFAPVVRILTSGTNTPCLKCKERFPSKYFANICAFGVAKELSYILSNLTDHQKVTIHSMF